MRTPSKNGSNCSSSKTKDPVSQGPGVLWVERDGRGLGIQEEVPTIRAEGKGHLGIPGKPNMLRHGPHARP